jgi:hypothetical protein
MSGLITRRHDMMCFASSAVSVIDILRYSMIGAAAVAWKCHDITLKG